MQVQPALVTGEVDAGIRPGDRCPHRTTRQHRRRGITAPLISVTLSNLSRLSVPSQRTVGTVTRVIERPPVDLATVRRLVAEVETAALCDAVADIRVMSPALHCRSAHPVLCGRAATVRCRNDFFVVIEAIAMLSPVNFEQLHTPVRSEPLSPNLGCPATG
jgi:hypothetical protein